MKNTRKVVLVTGGARGIGSAYCDRFANDGYAVVVADRLDKDGEMTVNAIIQRGGTASYVHCDVTNRAQVESAMSRAVSEFGRLDVCIANAGVLDEGHFLDLTEASFDRVMGVNVKGVFLTGQCAARQMIACGNGGVIINIASTVAILAVEYEGFYPVSKAAVGQMTRVMAVSLADHGIRVVGIAPGATKTPMMAEQLADPVISRAIEARTPMRRAADPAEIAGVAAFLASDDASYMTGQTLYVEGGRLVLSLTMPER